MSMESSSWLCLVHVKVVHVVDIVHVVVREDNGVKVQDGTTKKAPRNQLTVYYHTYPPDGFPKNVSYDSPRPQKHVEGSQVSQVTMNATTIGHTTTSWTRQNSTQTHQFSHTKTGTPGEGNE